jgi:hypothetical protein
MPLLEHFGAYGLIGDKDSNGAATERTKLPLLRKFETQDDAPCIAAVLRHLSFPPNVVLAIRCTLGRTDEAEVHDLLHTLSPHLDANRGRFAGSAVEVEVDYHSSHLRAADKPDETPWIAFSFDMDVGFLAAIFHAHLPSMVSRSRKSTRPTRSTEKCGMPFSRPCHTSRAFSSTKHTRPRSVRRS